jgi:hypothetical protein
MNVEALAHKTAKSLGFEVKTLQRSYPSTPELP